MARKRAQSMTREYAEAPAMMSFGLCSCASRSACVVVDLFGRRIKAVGDDLEPLARQVDRRAVGQVAAVRQRHAEDRVARLEHGEENRLVRLRARMRLDVGEFGVEELLGAVDRQLLGDVDELAAAVVALARIPFGVFVGQLRALRRHHGDAGIVFRGDELDLLFLAKVLAGDRRGQFGIGLRKGQ